MIATERKRLFLSAHGKYGVAFYAEQKVIMARWF